MENKRFGRRFAKKLGVNPRKEELSKAKFTIEAAVMRKWQIFSSQTTDIGTDYMIGKDEMPLNPEVQLRTTWKRCDKRYNFELHGWEDDPKKFFAYFVVQAEVESEEELDEALKGWETVERNFYVVPMSDVPKIEPFKRALESPIWKETGKYKSTLTPKQIEKFLAAYKDDKGWALLEERAKSYKGTAEETQA